MGTTAQKLDYLNTTKGKIKDSINLTGAGITNATKFRNYAVLLKDKLAACIGDAESFVADLITNFPKGTRTGTNFQFNAYSTWDEYYFKGNTYQEQTSGKNLLDNEFRQGNESSTTPFNYIFSQNASKLNAGTYTFSSTLPNTFQYAVFGTVNDFPNSDAKVYNSGWVLGGTNNTFTINQSLYVAILIRKVDYSQSMTPSMVSSYNFQLESGSSATSYVPYVGGTDSPNPNYPQPIQVVTGNQEIEVCGKNFINLSNGTFTDGANLTITIQNQKVVLNGTTSNNYLWINLTKKDYRYGTPNTSNKPTWFNEKMIPIGQYYGSSTDDLLRILYADGTTSTGAYVSNTKQISSVGLYIQTSGTSFNNKEIQVQLEKGNQATTYEPYIGNTYSINLGKNLLEPNFTSDSHSDITCEYSDGGWLINGLCSATYTNFTIFSGRLEKGTYTINGITGASSTTYQLVIIKGGTAIGYVTSSKLTFTLTEDSDIDLRLYVYQNYGTFNNLLLKYQLEKGSVATSFSPYFTPIELCKINDYKDSIKKSEGKNLFDKDTNNFIQGYYLDNNGVETAGTNWGVYYISVEPNKSYSISNCQTNGGVSFCWFTENKTFISRIGQKQNRDNMVAPNNAYYLGLSIVWNTSSSAYDNFLMLNEGTTPLPYEPYLAKGKWYIEKNIGKVVLKDVNYSLSTTLTNVVRARATISFEASSTPSGVCNGFVFLGNYSNDSEHFYIQSTSIWVFINKTRLSEISDTGINNFIDNNNFYAYYVLATPTYTEITNEELISQLNSIELLDGLNNISITSADLPAEMNLTYLEKEEIV